MRARKLVLRAGSLASVGLVAIVAAACADLAPSRGAAHANARVELVGHTFTPATVEIEAGDGVTFVNAGDEDHDILFDDPAVPSVNLIRPGERKTIRFPRRGRFHYSCDFHAGMNGTVVVRQ